MITRLCMRNVRQHVDTELTFEPGSQLVVINGRNGHGKSTILEAALWALYGETRKGRAGQDKMVRRGGELEGMTVELDFTCGGQEYTVVRRRDNGSTYAVLRAGGVDVVTGSNQVSAEVARIFGMDAAGFKVAVVAQQKELDALARKGDTDRARTITRLLRQDVITRAAAAAQDHYNDSVKVLHALGPAPDADEAAAALARAEGELSATLAAREESTLAVGTLSTRVRSLAHVEEAFSLAHRRLARAEGAAETARTELERLAHQRAGVNVPESLPAPRTPLADLQHAAAALEREIARGEAAVSAREQVALLTADIRAAQTRTTQIAAALADLVEAAEAAEAIGDVEAELVTLADCAGVAAQTLDVSRRNAAAAAARAEHVAHTASRVLSLDAVCPTCEQEVGDQHRQKVAQLAESQAAEAEECAEQARAAEAAAEAELARVEARRASLLALRQRLTADCAQRDSLLAERADIERRVAVYESSMQRLHVEDVDLDELFARKADLALEISLAQQHAEHEAARAQVQARLAAIDDAVVAATARLEQAESEMSASAVPADLSAAHAELVGLRAELSEESDLLYELTADVRVAEAAVATASRRVERIDSETSKRTGLQATALTASDAAKVLRVTAQRLADQIRPSLQGEISAVLAAVSEGRFTAVEVDQNYNVTVSDGGAFQPLDELSGGEQDLLALAVRLALSGVVADRHGADGPDFLFLDETFGSQDTGRRAAILAALRGLKNVYGQIFLISHVGGIEDEADLVVEVTASTDEEGRRVACARIADPAALPGEDALIGAGFPAGELRI